MIDEIKIGVERCGCSASTRGARAASPLAVLLLCALVGGGVFRR